MFTTRDEFRKTKPAASGLARYIKVFKTGEKKQAVRKRNKFQERGSTINILYLQRSITDPANR